MSSKKDMNCPEMRSSPISLGADVPAGRLHLAQQSHSPITITTILRTGWRTAGLSGFESSDFLLRTASNADDQGGHEERLRSGDRQQFMAYIPTAACMGQDPEFFHHRRRSIAGE